MTSALNFSHAKVPSSPAVLQNSSSSTSSSSLPKQSASLSTSSKPSAMQILVRKNSNDSSSKTPPADMTIVSNVLNSIFASFFRKPTGPAYLETNVCSINLIVKNWLKNYPKLSEKTKKFVSSYMDCIKVLTIEYPNERTYVGQSFKGKREGFGILTDKKQKIKYVGLWRYDMRDGFGQHTKSSDPIHDIRGIFKNDEFPEKGKMKRKLESGAIYDGDFSYNIQTGTFLPHGSGIITSINLNLTGIFNQGQGPQTGTGSITESGRRYIGDLARNSNDTYSANGQVEVYDQMNQLIYSGQVKQNVFHGFGKYYLSSNGYVEGIFENGTFQDGKVKFVTKDHVYEGTLKLNAKGVDYTASLESPQASYVGSAKLTFNGLQFGSGTLKTDKFITQGNWKDNVFVEGIVQDLKTGLKGLAINRRMISMLPPNQHDSKQQQK